MPTAPSSEIRIGQVRCSHLTTFRSFPDLVTVRDPDDDDDSPDPKSIVAVEVLDTRNGATHFWSLEKLR